MLNKIANFLVKAAGEIDKATDSVHRSAQSLQSKSRKIRIQSEISAAEFYIKKYQNSDPQDLYVCYMFIFAAKEALESPEDKDLYETSEMKTLAYKINALINEYPNLANYKIPDSLDEHGELVRKLHEKFHDDLMRDLGLNK